MFMANQGKHLVKQQTSSFSLYPSKTFKRLIRCCALLNARGMSVIETFHRFLRKGFQKVSCVCVCVCVRVLPLFTSNSSGLITYCHVYFYIRV